MSKPKTKVIASDRCRSDGAIHEIVLTEKLQIGFKNHPRKTRRHEETCRVICQKPKCKCYDVIELVRNRLVVLDPNNPIYVPKNIKKTLYNLQLRRFSFRRGINSPPIDKGMYYRRLPVISSGVTFARILRAKLRIGYAEPNWKFYHLVTFNEKTKLRAYKRQTEEALRENGSNCPICSKSGLEEFKNKIWAFEEMRCEYIVKLKKKRENPRFKCTMLCKLHNKDPYFWPKTYVHH